MIGFHLKCVTWFACVCVIAPSWPVVATDTALQPQTQLESASSPVRRDDLQLLSSASCAATACHGGPRAGVGNAHAVRGSEYPLWLEKDPHARSWKTLCSPESLCILQKLKIVADGQIRNQEAYDNCLACHNSTKRFDEPRSQAFHAEGIGCTACHGPSEKWESLHFQRDFDRFDHPQIGYVQNQDLLTRARVCASCHVGDADRDMNHDIIAAGHPPLHFEFATYHNRLPKHWREAAESSAEFEARLWLAGQIANLDASLNLLEHRARGSLSLSAWPEFAAADCAGCHQNLRLPASSSPHATANASFAGLSQWNQYGILAFADARSGSDVGMQGLAEQLLDLNRLVQQNSVPDRLAVMQQSIACQVALDEWLGQSGRDVLRQFNARELVSILAKSSSPGVSWDAQAQFYLGVIAARNSWKSNTALSSAASSLRSSLLFPNDVGAFSVLDWPARDIEGQHARLMRLIWEHAGKASVPENTYEEVSSDAWDTARSDTWGELRPLQAHDPGQLQGRLSTAHRRIAE